MGNLLKYEFYKLAHNLPLLIMLPVLILVSVVILHVNMGTYIETTDVLVVILANPVAMMWAGVLLAPYFFNSDFNNRTINGTIYSGHSRRRILFAKMLSYYIITVAILLISLFIALFDSKPGWWSSMPIDFIAIRLLLSLMINIGTMSFPIIFSFLFQDILKSMGVAVIFTYGMQQLIADTAKNISLQNFMRFYPPYLQTKFNLWYDMSFEALISAVASSLLCALLAGSISFILFNRRELK